ncbi:MAG: HAMP domain-containing protein [Candidatus Schekmanbacteria bacterium]|nr:HAMP domain-containing protein [Candidatus Schekmanbacteria bacterium]
MARVRLGLRPKILVAFGGLLALLVVVGVLGLGVLEHYSTLIDRLLYENYRSVTYAQKMLDARAEMAAAATLAMRGDPAARELAAAAHRQFAENLAAELDNITLPGERDIAGRLQVTWRTHAEALDRLCAPALPAAERERVYREVFLETGRRLREDALAIARMNLENMVTNDGQVKQTAGAARGTMVALVAAGVVLAVALIVTLSRAILGPLRTLTASARAIAAGDLDLVVTLDSGDEVGQLADAFNTMAAHLRERRHRQRARCERIERSTQLALDSLPSAVAIVLPDGTVELANAVAARLFGIAPGIRLADLALRGLSELVRAATSSLQPQEAHGYAQALQVFDAGTERFFLPGAVPILDERREVTGVSVILADVTDLRRLDEMKSGMLSVVSHELKSPLTSLRMAVYLLLEERAGTLTAKQAELLLAARDDSDRLHRIVDNLLDIGRIETGAEHMGLEPHTPLELTEAAVESLQTAFRDQGVTLTVDVPADLPLVLADPVRIAHVFSNLLTNALRFTPPGGEVAVAAEAAEELVRFRVRDGGPGVPAAFHRRIFERFFRIPGQHERSGVGLGLAIAREIVQAHGGEISVESAPGEGATFNFTLRLSGATDGKRILS